MPSFDVVSEADMSEVDNAFLCVMISKALNRALRVVMVL